MIILRFIGGQVERLKTAEITQLGNYKLSKRLYIIITGNGTHEIPVLEELCNRYNGHDKFIWFPLTAKKRQTGLSALNAVKHYPSVYRISSLIYLVDGEHIEGTAKVQIKNYLQNIGIEIVKIIEFNTTFLINCKVGNHKVSLYCVILGPETFFEEEQVKLIELELGITIDISGNRDKNWKKRIKREIKRLLREKGMNIKELIRNASKNNLERAFSNLCEILKDIEKDC